MQFCLQADFSLSGLGEKTHSTDFSSGKSDSKFQLLNFILLFWQSKKYFIWLHTFAPWSWTLKRSLKKLKREEMQGASLTIDRIQICNWCGAKLHHTSNPFQFLASPPFLPQFSFSSLIIIKFSNDCSHHIWSTHRISHNLPKLKSSGGRGEHYIQ